MKAFRPAHDPQLLPQHGRARLTFAREYADWTMDEWKDIMVSDESRIASRGPGGQQYVYRCLNERFAPCVITETVG